jgi:N utilization substance protein B
MEDLATGAAARASEIDRRIEQHSQNWRIDRMPAVDRNILRLSIYELLSRTSPPAVVIDEAIELARRFSGDESVSFVNGVLDAVHRELEKDQPRA